LSNDGIGRRRTSWILAGAGMLIVVGVAAAMLLQEPGENEGLDPKGCLMPKGAARAAAFVELPERIRAKDSVAEAKVCLVMRDPKVRIGSYHGLITWDSTKAKLEEVEKGRMGMRIENTTRAGAVDFAGAFPGGFDDRAALTLKLVLAKPGKLPPLTLHMYELNEISGTILTSMLTVTGYPSTVKTVPGPMKKPAATVATTGGTAVPLKADSAKKKTASGGGASTTTPVSVEITSVAPATPAIGSEAVIRGKGFMPTGNTVQIGRVEIRDLPSADGGTLIRFTIPTEVPAKGEVPPMQLGPGEYTMVVRNARGTSNTLRFMVRD
jgi:hypothetical protein